MSETKLVERLRAWRDVAKYADDWWDMPPSGCDFLSRLCTNAADEIERLHAMESAVRDVARRIGPARLAVDIREELERAIGLPSGGPR
jgi:hypothetical protein